MLKICGRRKKAKPYDATVLLDDTGGKYINFKLEFQNKRK